MELVAGAAAPDFSLQTDGGETFTLSEQRGKRVVLYFYPKADTPGCTLESQEFGTLSPEFAKRNTEVVGVSPDGLKSQCKFKAKYELPFTLLCDTEHATAEGYGVWVEKSMYGKKYMGVERSTFVIGPDGAVERVYRKVKPEGHAQEVLDSLA